MRIGLNYMLKSIGWLAAMLNPDPRASHPMRFRFIFFTNNTKGQSARAISIPQQICLPSSKTYLRI